MIPYLFAAAIAADPAAPIPANAGLDAAQAAAFGDHLLNADDAYNALTWYRLALFLEPGSPRADALRFREGLAYERGERWEAAVYAYGQVGGDLAAHAAYRSALCEFHNGHPEVADQVLNTVQLYHPDSEWAPRAAYVSGALALERYDLDLAAERFGAFSAASPALSTRATELASAASQPLPHKRPLLAASLSVVPGLGQLYAGHPGDAFMAAGFNLPIAVGSALLLTDGIQQRRALEITTGAFLAGVFSLTYPSQMVGAYRGALRTNKHRERRAAEVLLQRAWTPELELEADEVTPPQ